MPTHPLEPLRDPFEVGSEIVRGLGELEAAIMEAVWRSGRPVSVRAVQEQLSRDREIAYTTVMTVMERLWRKGLLSRRMQGKAYLYRAARSRPEFAARIMREMLRWARDPQGVFVRFVEELKPSEADELRRLVDQKRRKK